MTTEDIRAAIAGEAAALQSRSFPLEVFPAQLQRVVGDMADHSGYILDYLCPVILSAAATAIGNALRIRIRGNWTMNPTLYMVLVGKPGVGKSPPIDPMYRSLINLDSERILAYRRDLDVYNAARKDDASLPRPVLRQTLVCDFTLEALARAHESNPRGVTIKQDEINDLFTSASRYNNSPLISQLLTAWSGGMLKYDRVSLERPMVIANPCIGIIGSIQTSVFNSFVRSGNCRDNGMLDRMTVAYPFEAMLQHWNPEDDDRRISVESQAELNGIIGRLSSIEYDGGEGKVLDLTQEARRILYEWQNANIDQINACSSDEDVDTRLNKLIVHTSRFALIVQALRWALGEAGLDEIDERSVRSAIRLNEYFQDCYSRLMDAIDDGVPSDQSEADRSRIEDFAELLGDEFTTADAVAAGQLFKMSERTTKRWVMQLARDRRIVKVDHGRYRSIDPSSEPK